MLKKIICKQIAQLLFIFSVCFKTIENKVKLFSYIYFVYRMFVYEIMYTNYNR